MAEAGERRTALYELHLEQGARMVPFAGYAMPVQYQGIVAEHLHTRAAASLFDVSHMGQVLVRGVARELEKLLPVDLEALPLDHCCYTFFTTDNGAVLDDLIVTRRGENEFMLVLNASRIDVDLAHLHAHLAAEQIEHFPQQALLALQGPQAQRALVELLPDLESALDELGFMHGLAAQLHGFGAQLQSDAVHDANASIDIYISRSGYSGEDGFEISLPARQCEAFVRALLAQDAVQMAGLGARDSLRLEAGLCLYGHDLDENTTPIEAGLGWSIDKSRRCGGARAGGFPGAEIILAQMENGAPRKRIGFIGEGRAPVREGALLVDATGNTVGTVSSGGFSPSLERPIGMAYVNADALERVSAAIVRGKQREISRCHMPFVAHKYLRK